jgi:transcriptional regulator with XRE-family HTH domain
VPFRPDRLRDLRSIKGWSQVQLADRARLSHALIAKTENGKNSPRSDALAQLAQALDCTTDYLLGLGSDYGGAAAAASQMSLDIFIAQRVMSHERLESCRRVLQHQGAPKTVDDWRSFAEMLDIATGSHQSKVPVSAIEESEKQRKPIVLPRRIHRHS